MKKYGNGSKKYSGEYYIGLDIGTDSVGAAAIDERYKPIKVNGEPVMVSHLFDAAKQCGERRAFRTARRRLERKKQRIQLIDEIFANEVCKVDPGFYIRKKESALYNEDSTYKECRYLFFNENGYNDSQYYSDYPTIHHLISFLMDSKGEKPDIRLINIAVDWLVAHRGHFLSEVGIDNIDNIMDFNTIYNEFVNCFERLGKELPWDRIDATGLGDILKKRGVNRKKKELTDYLFNGKIEQPEDDYFLNVKELVTLMAGGKIKASKLFLESDYDDDLAFSIDGEMDIVLPQLGDDAEIIAKLAMMYDWSVLSDILDGNRYISAAKVKIYEQHKKDLKELKAFVRKYEEKGVLSKGSYNEIFRISESKLKNYTAYSYNVSSVPVGNDLPEKKATGEEFYAYLKKKLEFDKNNYDVSDSDFIEDVKLRMEQGLYMPKQVTTDNRVIPYQLFYIELDRILHNASSYYNFLKDRDEYGYSNIDKIISVFVFRIPYYVGPLVSDDKSRFAWMVRKAEGKIYPWNFEKMVDQDASEQAFIQRMTNICTYIPGEDVIPKFSLLYSKYMVLNEINNIKVNGLPISVEAKQAIYNELFCRYAKVTVKKVKEYLVTNGYMQIEDELGGLDETVKSNMKSRYDFRHLLEKNVLKESDVERIIERRTYTEEKGRYHSWLKKEYPLLNEEDFKYVSRLNYSDFGRLSKAFLCETEGMDKETGEVGSIMHFLWVTNDNLMQLLSDKYTFLETIEGIQKRYYEDNPRNLSQQLEDMGVSNAVKRPIVRTIDVVKDMVSGIGKAPKKIFIEMARGADKEKKRTRSRFEQIMDLYNVIDDDTRILENQLREMGDMANNKLQSDALFLYYMQLGKCMYSGNPIDLSQIKSTKYNIDHIYPQSLVKDDSLLNNRVLVESVINGEKKDIYPIDASIRMKMTPFWKMLCDKGLITKEKYARLVRNSAFTEKEKMGFINRQLVETRQSTKAVAGILKQLYPDSQIIYVKANLAADFRHEFLTPKSRLINDLHHAKDAYLNAVVGNVYYEKFTNKWFKPGDEYSMKTGTLFTRELKHGDNTIWKPDIDLVTVKRVYSKNAIHLVKYAYCSKGGLFDQMPLKKSDSLVPMKKGMDADKYGGYNKPAASFFVLAKYVKGKKKELSFVPVELMFADRFITDEEFAKEYVKGTIERINNKTVSDIELPLGKRIIKVKSLLSIDGYKVWINGKANGGKIVQLSNAESMIVAPEWEEYIKRIESFSEKKKKSKAFMHDKEYDGLSEEKNMGLFMLILSKLENSHYSSMPGNQRDVLRKGVDKFKALTFDEQIKLLLSVIEMMKSGRTGGCDLSLIGGKTASGAMTLGANLSSGKAKDIRLLDYSPAGLHLNISCNLLELL